MSEKRISRSYNVQQKSQEGYKEYILVQENTSTDVLVDNVFDLSENADFIEVIPKGADLTVEITYNDGDNEQHMDIYNGTILRESMREITKIRVQSKNAGSHTDFLIRAGKFV